MYRVSEGALTFIVKGLGRSFDGFEQLLLLEIKSGWERTSEFSTSLFPLLDLVNFKIRVRLI